MSGVVWDWAIHTHFFAPPTSKMNPARLLPSGTTPSFKVNVGIPQGGPMPPYLFIMVTEMLAIYIKNGDDIKNLNVFGTSFLIRQLADD